MIAAIIVVIALVVGGDDDGVDWLDAQWESDLVAGTISGGPADLFAPHTSGRIAYRGDDAICVADVTAPAAPVCHPFEGTPSRLHASWSPDGKYLAFTEDFVQLLYEPDIWLWDVEQNSLVDLTDDGEEGVFGSEPRAMADVFPVFVSDREIAFLRLSLAGEGPRSASLWTLDVAGGDPIRVDADPLPLDHFLGMADGVVAFPAGRDGRWFLAVSDPTDPALEILSVDIANGTTKRVPVTGNVTLDDGLYSTPDPTGRMIGLSRTCFTYGAEPGRCVRYVIDPVAATATATPELSDDRFDPEREGSLPTAFAVALSPDLTAAAGCFTTGSAGTNLIAITSLDQPEWKVIAEFQSDETGPCSGPPAWTEAGIVVSVFDYERYFLLRVVE